MLNKDIRDELKEYGITYYDILKYLNNFSHIQRISEELSKPLTEQRKKEYLLAIQKVKEEKLNLYKS